jgi:hypothetical protein
MSRAWCWYKLLLNIKCFLCAKHCVQCLDTEMGKILCPRGIYDMVDNILHKILHYNGDMSKVLCESRGGSDLLFMVKLGESSVLVFFETV